MNRRKQEHSILNPISTTELKRRISDLKNQKATGPDDIPNEFLKALKTKARETLRHYFNNILESGQIPPAWKEAKVTLIHKGKGKPLEQLNAYRPISIISNVQKLFSATLNRRLQKICESNNIFPESQNGFRPNRRTSDHIFTLTQALEMKNKEKSTLYLAFLDMEKAYDGVPHSRLWQKLQGIGLECKSIDLLKELYTCCTAVYKLHELSSKKVQQKIGLKQGCPLSPTLFNIYITQLLQTLDNEGPGLRMSTITTDGQEEYTKISCLAFADDIVLLAESAADLQHQLDICSRVAGNDQLRFNTEKTQYLGININNTGNEFTLQGNLIKKTSEYKYLGVTLCDQPNYLYHHQNALVKKSNRLKGNIWNLARHSYNPYTVGRTLWKAIAVPATTYADDALAYSSETIKCLERHQIELGRWLLGGSMATANAAVSGEMSWSSYEAREARSKLQYAGRLKFMANTSYSRRIYLHLRYKNIKTDWIRKYTSLNTKYNQNSKHHETKTETEWRKAVIKEINEAETSIWRTAVAKKQSLALYHQHKLEPCPSTHYRGDRGSALLFQARTGALLTNQRRHELFGVDPTCHLCGAQVETLLHVLQQCPRLPTDPRSCTLAESLALTGNTEEERAARAEATKTRLEQWERQGRCKQSFDIPPTATSSQQQ
ncbi:hypothetical protein HPB49_002620 [Dermacentor silvarum]|uniref:Uncharacterized protein n=1 Tax=Dermacentor silvarum TaxID=543639 RepID=A0ACB8CUT2_DERSI|nr:hypothetical protein HPB49_002620 [Dermacentor silvarum]